MLIPGKDQFYISIAIRIVKDDSNFEIYQIVHEPVYNPETQLSAKFTLEANVLAITPNREKYMILGATPHFVV